MPDDHDSARTRDADQGTAPGTGLRIRCPHCQQTVIVVDDQPLLQIRCSACGSTFGVVGDETSTPQSPGDPAGQPKKLGRFELLEMLGAGQFGTVWKAHDTLLGRFVAVKVPRRGLLTPDEVEKFMRESRAAAQLRHPRIVGVHEVGTDGQSLYIVSDYVPGVSLETWLRNHHVTPAEAAGLTAKIAEAIHHAHEQGVIHRDLKPSNILMDATGEPYVTDFGLAKRETGEIPMTRDGELLGTPAYMSPEQARGEGHHVDRRADVYSLGGILYRLITGTVPFRGHLRMILKQVLEDEPVRPSQLNRDLPRDLETICLKCLGKEPSQRYATALALADDLGRFQRGETIWVRPAGRLERGWRWCRRKPALAALSFGTLGLLVIGLVLAAFLAVEAFLPSRGTDPTDSAGDLQPVTKTPDAPVVQQAEPFDLLAIVDPERDPSKGDWKRDGGTLVCGKGLGFRIEIPYAPPEEYVLTTEAERVDGLNTFVLGLVSGGRQFNVMLDYNTGPDSYHSALENIDGRNFGSNETKVAGMLLPRRGVFKAVCTVRREQVTVDVDNKQVIDWRGAPSRLSPNSYWKTSRDDVLFVGAYLCSYRIHRLELNALTGVGRPLRPSTTD